MKLARGRRLHEAKYEQQGLLARPAKELWGVGAAQIFSDVSPAMHVEFALRHEARHRACAMSALRAELLRLLRAAPPAERGAECAGAPLRPGVLRTPLRPAAPGYKVDILRRHIPHLRKISMSPWVDFDKAVAAMGREFIFAWEPNPAVLAAETWDPEYVRRDMEEKLHKARNCVVEIHMQDISTVRYQPQRLWEWARIASAVTEEYAV